MEKLDRAVIKLRIVTEDGKRWTVVTDTRKLDLSVGNWEIVSKYLVAKEKSLLQEAKLKSVFETIDGPTIHKNAVKDMFVITKFYTNSEYNHETGLKLHEAKRRYPDQFKG